MATGVICAPPILQFTLNNGQLAVGGSILTQVGGVNAATFQDQPLTVPLPNPIPLNSRGEISTAAGASAQLFLTPNTVYTFTLFDGSNGTGNQIWVATYVNGVQTTVTQAVIGLTLYPQTAAEAAAGITPTNYVYVPYDVRRYGVVFDGVTDNTAALALSAAVLQHSLYLIFDAGGSSNACAYATSPNWAVTGGVIDTHGEILMKCTGAGHVMDFDAGVTPGVDIQRMTVGSFILDGGTTATVGLNNRGIVRSQFGHFNVKNIAAGSNAAFLLNSCVLNTYQRPTCSINVQSLASVPFYGMFFSGRGGGDFCSNNVVIDPCFEGVTDGIYLAASSASNNFFIGGTCEACGTGITELSGNNGNMFLNIGCQNNTVADWVSAGRDSMWKGGYAASLIHFNGGAFQTVESGQTASILIDNTCIGVSLSNLEYGFTSFLTGLAGTLTDNSGGTTYYRNVRTASGAYHADTSANGLSVVGSLTVSPALSTGWGSPTGASAITNLTCGPSASLTTVSEAVGQIIITLKSVGILGA